MPLLCCHSAGPVQAESWAQRNLMRFNECEWRILHLGRNNCTHQYSWELSYWKRSSVGKDLGVLVASRLAMSQRCAFVAKDGTMMT